MGTFGHYGPADAGNAWHGVGGNSKNAYGAVALYEAGTITKLTGWGKGSPDGAMGHRMFVYTDNAGVPNNLVVASSELVVAGSAPEGWKDFTVSPTHVNAGVYHVGIHFPGSGDSWMHSFNGQTDGITRQRAASDTYSDGTAATYGSITASQSSKGYYFATYTPDVVDTTPPACTLILPDLLSIEYQQLVLTPGANVVSGTTPVVVVATDNVNVKTVDLKADGAAFRTIAATVGQTSFSFQLDTHGLVNGTHSLTATATDPQGNAGTSGELLITVHNSVYPLG
jgi:hypothetical protein